MALSKTQHETYYLGREMEVDWSKRAGWRDGEAQRIRFAQFLPLLRDAARGATVTDVGCGYGDFLTFLRENGPDHVIYRGVDINRRMIDACRERFNPSHNAFFNVVGDLSEIPDADYSVASGVFSGKFDTDDETWTRYVCDSVEAMYRKSRLGVAFNLLSDSSDPDRRDSYLYYASASRFFSWASASLSPSVALLHDYQEHDFTLIVRRMPLLRREG